MSRPRAPYVFAAVILAGVIVAVYASGVFGGTTPRQSSFDNAVATSLATVVRRTLTSQTEQSATLGYADASTVVAPSGIAPSALVQARQSVTTAQTQLASANAAATADGNTLRQARSQLAADRQKLAVDCKGNDAAASAEPAGSGSGSTPCATDAQTLTGDEQAVQQAATKVASDRQAVSSAATSLGTAQSAFATSDASATVWGQSSTYTELPAPGQITRRGEELYGVDGHPVSLLYGSVAAWRAFVPGMPPGTDVAELNANLSSLGYGGGEGDAFTSATSVAIAAFQSARGMPATGELLLGSVVFEPGPVRVTTVTPTLGATVQPGPVLGITSTRRVVAIELDAAQQGELKLGDPVVITLPDNSTTPGRVSFVGKVATAASSGQGGGGGDNGPPTIEVDVTPTDPAATGTFDQAPVNVSIITASAKNALVVPVDALLALASGGYAVEKVTAGVHQLVAVQLGLFDDADGLVQLTGSGLAPGQRVVVPAE